MINNYLNKIMSTKRCLSKCFVIHILLYCICNLLLGLHKLVQLKVNMLRNDDRLYHIVVSFPSICAKQFLILKFKRNEAICCLIGFGIGISCCLMYRWFKNTFCKINLINSNQSNLLKSSNSHTNSVSIDKQQTSKGNNAKQQQSNSNRNFDLDDNDHDTENSLDDYTRSLLNKKLGSFGERFIFNNNINNCSASCNSICNSNHSCNCCNHATNTTNGHTSNGRKHHTKKQIGQKSSNKLKKGDRLSRSSSQIKELTGPNKHLPHNNRSSYEHLSYHEKDFLLDQPLNDIYQNLAKFLTKNFCKNFKLRRSFNKKFIVNNENSTRVMGKMNPAASGANNQLQNINYSFYNSSTTSPSSPSSPVQVLTRGMFPTADEQSVKTSNSDTTLIVKRDSQSSEAKSVADAKPNDVENCLTDEYLIRNLDNDNCSNSYIRSRTVSNSAAAASVDCYELNKDSELTRSNANLADIKYNCFDYDDSIDLFHNNSNMSSTFDITESKLNLASVKIADTVDKSLEEALEHIDKLKEDMSHLCKDFDSLYAKNIDYANLYRSTNSINSSLDLDSSRRNSYFKTLPSTTLANTLVTGGGAKNLVTKCTQTELADPLGHFANNETSEIVSLYRCFNRRQDIPIIISRKSINLNSRMRKLKLKNRLNSLRKKE